MFKKIKYDIFYRFPEVIIFAKKELLLFSALVFSDIGWVFGCPWLLIDVIDWLFKLASWLLHCLLDFSRTMAYVSVQQHRASRVTEVPSTHRIHGTSISTYIYHKNQPNVGTCTIHGRYGLYSFIKRNQFWISSMSFSLDAKNSLDAAAQSKLKKPAPFFADSTWSKENRWFIQQPETAWGLSILSWQG